MGLLDIRDNDAVNSSELNSGKPWAEDVAVFFGFVATTVSFATTTLATRVVVELTRYASISIFFLIILALLFRERRIRRSRGVAVMLCILVISYGLALSVLNGGYEIVQADLLRDTLLIIAFSLVFSGSQDRIISDRLAKIILFYGVFFFFITIFLGGLDLSYPPKFVFEYSADLLGRATEYSQGVSKFYGFMAIISGFLSVKACRPSISFGYLVLTLLFISLSALGGARGDSVAAIVIVMIFVFAFGGRQLKSAVVGLVIFSVFLLSSVFEVSDFVLFSRLQGLDDGLGPRGDLYRMAYELISGQYFCSFFGCGFGYFQNHFNLAPGYYPHNLFLELAIVYGIPLSVFFLMVVGYAVYVDVRRNGAANILFYLVLFYLFIIQLKSGTLLGAWWLMAGFVCLSSRAVSVSKE